MRQEFYTGSATRVEDDITNLIEGARNGEQAAENSLYNKVYSELHQMAHQIAPSDDTSMQPTILVHELFVKLFRKDGLKRTVNRRYFFAVAGDQMRKLMIDHYRRKKRQRVGGDRKREPWELIVDGAIGAFESKNRVDFIELNDAIDRLRTENSRLYEVVMNRFFAGLSVAKTAEILDVSESSVARDWRLARAKLFADLNDAEEA